VTASAMLMPIAGRRPAAPPIKIRVPPGLTLLIAINSIAGDVKCLILAAVDEPIYQFPRMLDGQKGINENGVAFVTNECDRIDNPCEIFLSGRKTLGRATRFLVRSFQVSFGIYLGSFRSLFD
jgi:hypothetical protein